MPAQIVLGQVPLARVLIAARQIVQRDRLLAHHAGLLLHLQHFGVQLGGLGRTPMRR